MPSEPPATLPSSQTHIKPAFCPKTACHPAAVTPSGSRCAGWWQRGGPPKRGGGRGPVPEQGATGGHVHEQGNGRCCTALAEGEFWGQRRGSAGPNRPHNVWDRTAVHRDDPDTSPMTLRMGLGPARRGCAQFWPQRGLSTAAAPLPALLLVLRHRAPRLRWVGRRRTPTAHPKRPRPYGVAAVTDPRERNRPATSRNANKNCQQKNPKRIFPCSTQAEMPGDA